MFEAECLQFVWQTACESLTPIHVSFLPCAICAFGWLLAWLGLVVQKYKLQSSDRPRKRHPVFLLLE